MRKSVVASKKRAEETYPSFNQRLVCVCVDMLRSVRACNEGEGGGRDGRAIKVRPGRKENGETGGAPRLASLHWPRTSMP